MLLTRVVAIGCASSTLSPRARKPNPPPPVSSRVCTAPVPKFPMRDRLTCFCRNIERMLERKVAELSWARRNIRAGILASVVAHLDRVHS